MANHKTAGLAWRVGECPPYSPTGVARKARNAGKKPVERGRVTPEDLLDSLQALRIERLRRCSLLAGLSEVDLLCISEVAEEVSLNAGQDFLKQDQVGECLYVIVSGKILVYRTNGRSVERPIREMSAGDVLGEMSYFSNRTRSASARTLTPAQLLKIPYGSLPHLLKAIPRLAEGLRNLISQRLSENG